MRDITTELKSMKESIKRMSEIKDDNTFELEAIERIEAVMSEVSKKSLFESRACMFNAKPRVAPEKFVISRPGLAFY